jgi:glycogen operon protein
MLTAGDEFGSSQKGNNNAYAQDNALSWIDWPNRDLALEGFVAALAKWRAGQAAWFRQFPDAGDWLTLDGQPLTVADWENPATPGLAYHSEDPRAPYRVEINRGSRSVATTALDFEAGNS